MCKVLLVEFNDFHEEVIVPQLEFLKNTKYDVHLFINEQVKSKNLDFDIDKINYIKGSNKYIKALYIIKILFYIKNNNINIIIFNTLNSKYIEILNKILNNKLKKVAIVHNVDNFMQDKMDISNFMVLSENIFTYTVALYEKKYHFGYFYPLIHNQKSKCLIQKTSDQFQIVIPGLIELSRRDYLGLIELIKNITLKNVHFIILGNISKLDGPEVYKKIEEYNIQKYFTIYKQFVPYEEYFSVLKNADLIMPLIHPNTQNYQKYHISKITASFNMAFSFKIPLLIYESLYTLDEFKNYSISYNKNQLISVLENLSKMEINKLKKRLQNEKKFLFEFQKEIYLNFLDEII